MVDREKYEERYYEDFERDFAAEIGDLKTHEERQLALRTLLQYVDLMASVKLLPPRVVLVYYRLAMLYLPHLSKYTALRQFRTWLKAAPSLRFLLRKRGGYFTLIITRYLINFAN